MHVAPAQVADVMALTVANGFPLPRLHYKSLIAQVVVSEAYALRDDERGEPNAIVGCLDFPDRPGEIFFIARSGGLGRRLLPVCTVARRMLALAAPARPYGLVCWVRADNPLGQRLARALGFHLTDVVVADWRMWRFGHGRCGEVGQRSVRRR